jgi:hypothetical protein
LKDCQKTRRHSSIAHLKATVSEPHAYPQLLTSMGLFTHFTSQEAAVGESKLLNNHRPTRGHSSIHPLGAGVSEVQLSCTIADQHGDTRPLPISRLPSVSLNYQILLPSMGTFVHFTSQEAAVGESKLFRTIADQRVGTHILPISRMLLVKIETILNNC